MARRKHSGEPAKVPPRPATPAPEYSLHPRLYEGMEEAARRGDWNGWLHNALETGDPKFWPHILLFYREQPDRRHMILSHLRIYWREYEPMVAPLFREAMRDPEQCEEAVQAAAEDFPSLCEDVAAS